MKTTIFFSALFAVIPCHNSTENDPAVADYQCKVISLKKEGSRSQLLASFDDTVLEGLASSNVPNSNGAMGRNKPGYFHVRFQVGIYNVADYAVASQNTQALDGAIRAIEYSFEHQLPDGNFELIAPPNLSGQIANGGDLASGVAFFMASLGIALDDFDNSNWYNSASIVDYKNRIETLRPKINKAANWLLAQKGILETADQQAPNRLFFDALAFYSLGKWLKRSDLKEAGINFTKIAMTKKHPKGYFLEGDGWDSSYQGVSINTGLNLFSLLETNETIKSSLWDTLSCAADWQLSRISDSGIISTEGNTRVYPDGETFLGEEKVIDWIDTMNGFFIMGYYADNAIYNEVATKVKKHYYQ